MAYFVYIIYSDRVQKKYIGHTESIETRLQQHNEGTLGVFTKNKGPWRLIHSETFSSRAEAMAREKWLKSGVGRDWIKKEFRI